MANDVEEGWLLIPSARCIDDDDDEEEEEEEEEGGKGGCDIAAPDPNTPPLVVGRKGEALALSP